MIYENILRLCEQRGMTIRQLEDGARVGAGIVHNWKSRSVPRVDKVKQIADFLGVTLDELVSGENRAVSGSVMVKVNGETVLRDDFQSVEEMLRKIRGYSCDGENWTVTMEMGQQG